jgi:hypothetical protein
MLKNFNPLKTGFYCVDYIYLGHKKSAVYFELESAQEAFVKMVKRGVDCEPPRKFKSAPEILLLHKK